MFKALEEAGISIEEKYPGIYYLTGNVMFSTQIIVTGRLSDEHASLRILSRRAREADVHRYAGTEKRLEGVAGGVSDGKHGVRTGKRFRAARGTHFQDRKSVV